MDTNLSDSVLWRISQLADRLALSGRIPSPSALLAALTGAMEAAGEPLRLARERKKKAPVSLTFVSSSRREGSTLPQAVAGLHDPKFKQLESETPGGKSGIGFWSDGAEESRVVPGDEEGRARLLGGKYEQTSVLTFGERPDGEHRMHILRTPQDNPVAVYDTLHKHGIEYATVVPSKTGSMIFLVNPEGDVQAATKELQAKRRVVRGTATFHSAPVEGERMKLARPADYMVPTGKIGPRAGGGVNKPRIVGNKWFVKSIKPTGHGSPYAEEAAGKLREHLGLPSLQPRHATDKEGNRYTFMPFVHGMQTIGDAEIAAERNRTPPPRPDPKQVLHNLLADFLINDHDRNGGNYVYHPQHGLVSIDHGGAFHPGNSYWPDRELTGPSRFEEGVGNMSLIHHDPENSYLTPAQKAVNVPADMELYNHANDYSKTAFRKATVDPYLLGKAIHPGSERHLMRLAFEGTEDLPHEERLAAARAMQHRIRALRDTAKANNYRVGIRELEQAANLAQERYKADLLRRTQ